MTPWILAFDVFGTVVDWHTSVAREVDTLELGIDATQFARNWRAGYKPAMARDCILSAEIFRKYKPDPATYLGVADIFDVKAQDVMLVAAHQNDLDAARGCGLQTAYIERPDEFGIDAPKDVSGSTDNDYHAANLGDLADQLGC